ncbi:MAG: SDR family oxidoreductase [Sphingobacteriales bacterium]|nr:MAG: SDR family oxidoreductase [Sphingobacteriales bacterium]
MNYALITGASKGIGRAIAEELAQKKINVLLVARTAQTLKETASSISSRFNVLTDYLPVDLSSPGAPDKIYAWCKEKNYTVNILVNNAGYGLSGAIDRFSVEENEQMIQVNINSLVGLCQLFLPDLKKQPRAYILNIASTAAYQAIPLLNIYAASKAFVLSFSRALYHELKGSSVSVTCVSPGSTDTDFPHRAQVKQRVLANAKKVNMTPKAVANVSVKAMFNSRAELIIGSLNKLGAFMVWLLPKKMVEKIAMNIYR